MADTPDTLRNSRPTLLLVDDDATLCEVLARGLAARGFDVRIALTGEDAYRLIEEQLPRYAIIDLKLPDGFGLKLVSALKERDRTIRIVVLTGYGSIPTAVEAIKLGATYYLAKPANVDEIVNAMHRDAGDDSVPVNGKTMSLSRLEWEYIQRVLHQHGGNVAATARALSMHRRTLQRKIAKHPVRD
jgi:two-component system, response regulator RegA